MGSKNGFQGGFDNVYGNIDLLFRDRQWWCHAETVEHAADGTNNIHR